MLRLLRRLHPAGRKAPIQFALIALVLAAALASAITSRFRQAPAQDSAEAVNAISRLPFSSTPPVEEGITPAQPIEDAFEAARHGDLDGYLAQFTDSLQAQLARTRAEKGDAYLRDYLARLTVPIKGIAADLNRRESVGPETVRLPVEFVYADRKETQIFETRREGGRWRIRNISPVRAAPTLIPYGTPIEKVK